MKRDHGNDDFYTNYYFSVKRYYGSIFRFMGMLFNAIIFLV